MTAIIILISVNHVACILTIAAVLVLTIIGNRTFSIGVIMFYILITNFLA